MNGVPVLDVEDAQPLTEQPCLVVLFDADPLSGVHRSKPTLQSADRIEMHRRLGR